LVSDEKPNEEGVLIYSEDIHETDKNLESCRLYDKERIMFLTWTVFQNVKRSGQPNLETF